MINKSRQQFRETSFIWNENTLTCWQKFCHSRSRCHLFTVKCGFILKSNLSTPVAKFFCFSAVIIREGYTIFSSFKYKDNHDRSSKCFKSKHSKVPYSKGISKTILLDSMIFCNVHIFLLNKAALKLIRHCPTKYLVKKKKDELFKLWASSSIFYTKKIVKYFIVLILKPTLAGFLYI